MVDKLDNNLLRDPVIGPDGGWNHVDTPRFYAEFIARHDRYTRANKVLVDHAAIEPDHRILDVGAGLGHTALAALARLGPQGRIVCVEPARAMREAGQKALGDPRVGWSAQLPPRGMTFDRILIGSAIWTMGAIAQTVHRLMAYLEPEGALGFTIPSLYLGVPDQPGGGADALLLRLPAEVFANTPAANQSVELPRGLDAMESLLGACGLAAKRFTFPLQFTQEALRDWLKIPAVTEARLGGLSPHVRARRIDEAFAQVDAKSWRWEGWAGWIAWSHTLHSGVAAQGGTST